MLPNSFTLCEMGLLAGRSPSSIAAFLWKHIHSCTVKALRGDSTTRLVLITAGNAQLNLHLLLEELDFCFHRVIF